jgi:hypothetical protein
MLLLTALIVLRFFDTDVGLPDRGLAFIAVGVGFLVVNAMLLKRRKGGRMKSLRLASGSCSLWRSWRCLRG